MIRYYITDKTSCPRDLLDNIELRARDRVDYIQLREKDLSARELFDLTRAALLRIGSSSTRLLVNDRADVALAAGAHGVHLRSNPVPPIEWRRIVPPGFLIAVSCHSPAEIEAARGADFLVWGPVFETPGKGAPKGLDGLREAVRLSSVPVLALGGITEDNAGLCIDAGAAGIAAIRMFQT